MQLQLKKNNLRIHKISSYRKISRDILEIMQYQGASK